MAFCAVFLEFSFTNQRIKSDLIFHFCRKDKKRQEKLEKIKKMNSKSETAKPKAKNASGGKE